MKAIVMAGGEGTRLRPLTIERPKPMVRLMDRPVLDYILTLLKKHGITDVCLTLGYMPEAVREFVLSGSLGMNIECRVEKEPLGTAGGVKACADFIGEEDFLVISGDAMCDFDLSGCVEFHREKNAEATIVLYSHEKPLEYGLVVTSASGRVERFVEKPPWESVCTDCINTGVYILSPKILEDIPDGVFYDFGKDLFPKLLSENRHLFGVRAEGYWCDIGSPEALLDCAADMLDGKMDCFFDAAEVRPGVWSCGEIPEDASVAPPCYIGRGVSFGRNVRLGPHAVIGAGSRLGNGCSVRRSLVDGAALGERTAVSGAVLCRGVTTGTDCVVEEGAVIGDGTAVENRCYISRGIKVWPGKKLPEGGRIRDNIVTGAQRGGLTFGSGATICGEFNMTLTPEECVALGSAAAEKRVGISCCATEAAQVLASAFECGVRSSGGEAVRLDSSFPSCAAFSACRFNLPLSVMVREIGGRGEILFFEGSGLPLGRGKQRKIESAVSGELRRANTENTGILSTVTGTHLAYVAAAARRGSREKSMPKVWAGGTGAANRTLRQALGEAGCTVVERKKGVPSFSVDRDGFLLTAYDENGRFISAEQMLVLCALGEFENGSGEVAVPYGAPMALEVLAEAMGCKVLRLERDGKRAQEKYASQLFLRDGIFAAVHICSCLAKRGETLAEMASRIPAFSTVSREVRVNADRARVMRLVAESCAEMATELCQGLKINTDRGTVLICPCAGTDALTISGESENEETAEEICAEFEKRVRKIT